MNVWVRVASHIRTVDEKNRKDPAGSLKLTPELHLIVYPSKEQAEESRRKLGGVILEVSATSLGLEGQNEIREAAHSVD